ncbi:MAG: dual specificity protein phosphatase family protein [Deltaproteobacteria bacterium]|nr:dual specificity protein phosphatase family protein [Deltaproteobacteria bacterium]
MASREEGGRSAPADSYKIETGISLVRCQHGADRTGTMCALYRVAVQGWTKEEAIREMTEGGFGFHEVWKILPSWIKELDIESIRKDAGIQTSIE